MNLQRLDQFHKTRLGHLIFGLVELGLAYLVANKAMDNGSLILWAAVLILLVGFLQNFVHVMTGHKK